jgi:23S rRNA (cytidine2498-2'-O)-methyltransferase
LADARDLTPRLVAHCRAGFEPEAAADLRRLAAAAATTVEVDASPGRGFVVATPRAFDAQRWPRALADAPPVFVRALFFGAGPHALLETVPVPGKARADRVTPLVTLVDAFRTGFPLPGAPHRTRGRLACGSLRLETPDTNDGKELSGLCRAIEGPLAGILRERGLLDADPAAPALHVLLADGAHAYVGASIAPWASPWPMGIPRLRMPAGAPSRSTLKLAEAFVTFLGELELVHAGMRAVDLGAAPGGWTWQLAHRGLRVTAVDNGPLKGEVVHDPLVTHLRADGLTYLPRRPVDWLVCDIAEQPSRVAALVARWIGEGHARRAIFNLKLPMKKRFDETVRCTRIIEDRLVHAKIRYRIALRQLYHDRREVTGFVERHD